MIIAIQQPEHLPWLGFFDKMNRCERYVFLDNVQFKKRYFENRNKILTTNGPQWVTVPVVSKGKYTQKINEVRIDNTSNWRRKYLGSMKNAYASTAGFQSLFPKIQKILSRDHEKLVDLNLALIACLREALGIETPCLRASEILETNATGSDLILEICRALDSEIYISGPDGRNYLDREKFHHRGVEINYHDYHHPVYNQVHSTSFVSHMSAVDHLFNRGDTQ